MIQKFLVSFLIVILVLSSSQIPSFAHQSGCHRWHSCPSDSGSYVCGDLGYDTYCPKYAAPKYEPPKEIKKEQPKPSEKISPDYEGVKTTTCSGTALCITDRVVKIIDGDTIYIKKYKIRLSLTNTPEKDETGFDMAKSFTAKMCPLRSVITVDQDDKQPYDAYNRLVGKVTCSGKVLNSELLENGYANILTQYCKKSEFSSESWAKKFGC